MNKIVIYKVTFVVWLRITMDDFREGSNDFIIASRDIIYLFILTKVVELY